jgi:hypothetical protein
LRLGEELGPRCTPRKNELLVREVARPQISKLIGIHALANHIGKVLKDRSQSQGCFPLAQPQQTPHCQGKELDAEIKDQEALFLEIGFPRFAWPGQAATRFYQMRLWFGQGGANLFTSANHFLHHPLSCLIKVLFGMYLWLALQGFLCQFLFHAPIMPPWEYESSHKNFKMYHYRIFASGEIALCC